MSKYIDAEKLLSFVKDLEYVHPYVCENLYDNAYYNCLQEVKDFISFHLKKQPDGDLEKEIDVCWKNWLSPSNQKDVEGVLPKTEFAMYARHFFELGRNASKAIWHNVAEEMPTEIGAEVIVACRNKNKECGIWLYDLIQCWEGEWKPRLNWETPIRWAYVRDLDSERKEK